MYYKIVAVNDNAPDKPGVYLGEFQPVPGEHRVHTALATEFGNGAGSAAERLYDWSGGESEKWPGYVGNESADVDNFLAVANDDTTFYIYVSDRPFASEPAINPAPTLYLISNGNVGQITKAMVVDPLDDINVAIDEFCRNTRTPYSQVTVNPVGQPLSVKETK